MANALAPMMPAPHKMALPSSGLQTPEYLSPTAPVPPPVAPRAMPNALSAPNAYMGAPKKPQNEMLGAAVRGFQRGFDPEGFEKQREQGKADGQEKAKQTLALMQQQRQLPEVQRTQWWQQNAATIGEIIGQDISQQQVDPAQFSDQALDGQIAALSGQLGIAPVVADKMSEYEAAQIKLKEQEAAAGPKPQIYSTSKGLVEAAPGVDPRVVFATDPEEKPPWVGAVKGPDGQWAFDPNYIKGYRQLHPQSPSAGSAQYENVPAAQMESLGYPKGTVGQRNTRTGQIDVKSRPSTAQTGQPTESERSAGLHATVSINGLRNIMSREAGGYNRAGAMEQMGGLVGGENERLYDQAADEFIDGYLRAMTGAAATKNEIDTYKRQWFPALGDTPAVIAQKSAGRLNALKGMKSKAGRAWNPEWDAMISELDGEVGGTSAGPVPTGGAGASAAGSAMSGLRNQIMRAGQQDDGQDDDMDGFVDSLFPEDGAGGENPAGVEPEVWDAMTPEEKALFQ